MAYSYCRLKVADVIYGTLGVRPHLQTDRDIEKWLRIDFNIPYSEMPYFIDGLKTGSVWVMDVISYPKYGQYLILIDRGRTITPSTYKYVDLMRDRSEFGKIRISKKRR